MTDLSYRLAAIGDAADIHAMLLTVAAEIPLAIETLEREEALYAQVRKTLAAGESWIAKDGEWVVGCVLVDSVQTGRHWGENETLDLLYAAVAPGLRAADALDAMIGKVLERNVPITTSVRDANRIGLASQLEKFGFREIERRVGERHFRREP